MFVYLRRLIQSAKINTLGTQYRFFIRVALGILAISGALRVLGEKGQVWVDRGFVSSNTTLVIFIVIYLLVALLSVYRLCQKREGPIKTAA